MIAPSTILRLGRAPDKGTAIDLCRKGQEGHKGKKATNYVGFNTNIIHKDKKVI